jgi:hypothetical protein
VPGPRLVVGARRRKHPPPRPLPSRVRELSVERIRQHHPAGAGREIRRVLLLDPVQQYRQLRHGERLLGAGKLDSKEAEHLIGATDERRGDAGPATLDDMLRRQGRVAAQPVADGRRSSGPLVQASGAPTSTRASRAHARDARSSTASRFGRTRAPPTSIRRPLVHTCDPPRSTRRAVVHICDPPTSIRRPLVQTCDPPTSTRRPLVQICDPPTSTRRPLVQTCDPPTSTRAPPTSTRASLVQMRAPPTSTKASLGSLRATFEIYFVEVFETVLLRRPLSRSRCLLVGERAAHPTHGGAGRRPSIRGASI